VTLIGRKPIRVGVGKENPANQGLEEIAIIRSLLLITNLSISKLLPGVYSYA
jgi:hypothetical protein